MSQITVSDIPLAPESPAQRLVWLLPFAFISPGGASTALLLPAKRKKSGSPTMPMLASSPPAKNWSIRVMKRFGV